MLKDRLNKINREYILRGAEKMKEEDLRRVVDRAEDIRDRFEKDERLGRMLEDGKLLLRLVRDYWKGRYRRIPWWAIAAVAFALLYVLAPLDIIPDFIPGTGLLDDATVVGLCLNLINKELQEYRKWKE